MSVERVGITLGDIYKKTGKLLTSHRYNQTPLLHSCPGGFIGSWPYKTCQGCKCKEFLGSFKDVFAIFY